jgi:hypothetical protein
VQWLTTIRATRNVDPQEQSHPLGGRVRLLVGLLRSGAEQLAAPRQVLLFAAIGQQAVMPDAEEAVRQDVLQEAVEEFLGGKDIRLQSVAVAAVAIAVTYVFEVAHFSAVAGGVRRLRHLPFL